MPPLDNCDTCISSLPLSLSLSLSLSLDRSFDRQESVFVAPWYDIRLEPATTAHYCELLDWNIQS